MMSGNSHTDKNGDVADVSVLPVQQGMAADDVGEMEETSPEATRQQKLIKAGLLVVLAAIVVYVVLDYTVSAHSRHSQHLLTAAVLVALFLSSTCKVFGLLAYVSYDVLAVPRTIWPTAVGISLSPFEYGST